MDCNGNIYNIGMGCCEPVLGPIENYYTKPTIDRKLEEITSAITSGCCITPEEVDEKIEEAISGITVSGVTEEELNEAIASAKTEIEAEIPIVPTKVSAFENDVPYLTEHQSLSGYATEQWVENQGYITGVDLSDYATLDNLTAATDDMATQTWVNSQGYLTEHQSLSAYSTTEQMNAAISAATDGLATEDYVNAQISSLTSDFVTGEQLSSYTYDKGTIDEKIAQGGTFDPTQYYNTGQTDALLAEKLDVTAYTPTDLSNYYTTAETVNLVESAVTRVEGEIPTIPTNISAFNNDVGYITGVDLSNYATVDNLTAATDDMATQTWVNNQGYLTEHQSLSAYSTTQEVNTMINQSVSGKQDTLSAGTNITIVDNVISATGGGGATYTAGTGIDITSDVISTTLPISSGSGQYSIVVSALDNQYKPTATNQYAYAEGMATSAKGMYSHVEGSFTTATGTSTHAEGNSTRAYGTNSHAEGNNTTASGAYSHAEGSQTVASGQYSHAEGASATAATDYSHAEGSYTKANASYSHAEGAGSQTNGTYSHAEGYFTKTENSSEHASGQYNVSNKASATFGHSGNTLFSVGNGTGTNARNNAFEIRQNGDVYVTSGGTDVLLQDSLVTSTEKSTWNSKASIWCGTMIEYQLISGQTDNNTIYLIHS